MGETLDISLFRLSVQGREIGRFCGSKLHEFLELFKAALLSSGVALRTSGKYMKELLRRLWDGLLEMSSQRKYSDNEGRWNISRNEIGWGRNGTIIFEGSYGAREVAVKRLIKTSPDVGSQEYKIYLEADKLKNVVRCYGKESDKSFVYLFLELCSCNLDDFLIQMSQKCINHSAINRTKNAASNITLWKEDGHPSPLFVKIMRDVVQGLMDLHKINIVHRDLKPRNILINGTTPNLCAKLSDMSTSKQFMRDKSPLIHHSTHCRRQQLCFECEAAKDIFNLGHVLYFCINGGTQPFGVIPPQLDSANTPPEAIDLISKLRNTEANLRPKAIEVYRHPFFWDSDTKLSFLRDVSDMAEGENRKSTLAKELKKIHRQVVGPMKWNTKIDPAFTSLIEDRSRNRRQKCYQYNNFLDLLRLVRNNLNHYNELPEEIQELLGPVPEGYYDYFAKRFPKLLIEVYKVVHNLCNEERFQKYFNANIAE